MISDCILCLSIRCLPSQHGGLDVIIPIPTPSCIPFLSYCSCSPHMHDATRTQLYFKCFWGCRRGGLYTLKHISQAFMIVSDTCAYDFLCSFRGSSHVMGLSIIATFDVSIPSSRQHWTMLLAATVTKIRDVPSAA